MEIQEPQQYIHHLEEIDADFDYCVSDASGNIQSQYTVYLCILSTKQTLATTTDIPFFRYLVKPDTCEFPSFQYDCLGNPEENNAMFRNKLFLAFMEFMRLNVCGQAECAPMTAPDWSTMEQIYSSIYRGICKTKNPASIIAVLDYDAAEEHIRGADVTNTAPTLFSPQDPTTYPIRDDNIHALAKWAIADEVVCLQSILGHPVHPDIVSGFELNPILYKIYLADYAIPSPRLFYGVEEKDGVYYTELVPQTDEESNTTIHRDLGGEEISTYRYADDYGDRYCFTETPLPNTVNVAHCRRYACMPTGVWRILTPEEETIPDNYLLPFPLNLMEEFIKSDVVKDANIQEIRDDDEYSIKRIGANTIYFYEVGEHVGGNAVPMWGILPSERNRAPFVVL